MPTTRLKLVNKDYTYGDSIAFKHQVEFDSIIILDVNKNWISPHVNKKQYPLGYNSIAVTSYKNDKKLQKNFNIKILSDIPVVNKSYELIQIYPHDKQHFTQGLQYYDGFLYESSGLYRKSLLTKYNLGEITPILKQKIKKNYFAEGLTIVDDKIYVLTWENKKILVFDLFNMELITELDLPQEIEEGWGITYHESNFYISNGTEKIYILNKNFDIINHINVVGSEDVYKFINELEFVQERLFANVWQKNFILEINPNTGQVLAKIDFSEIVKKEKDKGADLLNGIAQLPNNHLLVTGKNWENMYEVEVTQD